MAVSSVRSNMESMVQATIDGFSAPLDYDALRATRTDDFVYQFLPKSLGAPPRDNDEYKDFFINMLKPLFTVFKVGEDTSNVKEANVADETQVHANHAIYDVEARRAAFYGGVDVESVIGPMSMDLVMMLCFNEAGNKITRIDEFFDSKTYTEFFAKVQGLNEQGAEP